MTRVTIRRALTALGLVLTCSTSVLGQGGRPIRFEQLSLEEGLSQSSVLAVAQDVLGYLWIGTEDGLNRYDGDRPEIFTHDPRDPRSIPNDFIYGLAAAANGDVWVATNGGGLAVWRQQRGSFDRYRHDPEVSGSIASDSIRSIALTVDGRLWVGHSNRGLDLFDPATGVVVEHYRHIADDSSSLSNDRVFALRLDDHGQLWVGTDDGLLRYRGSGSSFERFGGPGQEHSLGDQQVRSLYRDRDGMVWVGTLAGGLDRLDPDTGEIVNFSADSDDEGSLSHNRVLAILEDDAQHLWVGTFAGLDLLDRSRGRFDHYRQDDASAFALAGNNVSTLFQDRGGVLWIGTRDGGLNKWSPRNWNFGYESQRAGGLGDNNVSSFSVARDGRLWVGTVAGGVTIYDRATGATEQLRHDPGDPRSLPRDAVMTILHARNGAVWLGTMNSGLCRYRESSGFQCLRHDPDDPTTLASDRIVTLLEDGDDALWVGTFGGGLDRFDIGSGTAEHFPPRADDPTSISAGRVLELLRGPEGALWVGTDGGGLNLFDPESRTAVVFRPNADDPTSLSSSTVQSLLETEDGVLWAGTRGGLHRLIELSEDRTTARFRVFTQRDGLSNDSVYGILPDGAGHLWLSTNLGLSRFDPETETFRNYSAAHGLQSNDFNFGAAHRAPDGELFFGGPQGFNRFYPERIAGNQSPPSVVLTSFLKFNEPVTGGQPPSQIRRIKLAHDDDMVTFEFAALDFAAPGSNRYAYRLEGFDEDWNDVGNNRRVTFTNLDPGSYDLRVRAANADGIWNQDGLALGIEVAPPPWRTAWAYALYAVSVLLGALGIALLVRRRLESQREYSRRLEREVEQRTAELAERADQLEVLNQKLEHASLTDSLTGLANRRFLTDYAERESALVRRSQYSTDTATETSTPPSLAFLMVDLDAFKAMNDSYGHAAGDALLLKVRDVLREVCRASDVLVRWGGDEFLVVGRDADVEQLEALAERIRSRIAAERITLEDGRTVQTTCSIGFAVFPLLPQDPAAFSWEQVITVADRALYVAKQSSRNAWVGFVANDRTEADGLLASIWDDPQPLFEGGLLDLRKSLSDDSLSW